MDWPQCGHSHLRKLLIDSLIEIQTPNAPNVQRKMILARRSSPAPSARHICRTKTKKTKSLTCLRHPMTRSHPLARLCEPSPLANSFRRFPSDSSPIRWARNQAPSGGIFFDNSPAFQGWDSSRTNIKVPSGTADNFFRP